MVITWFNLTMKASNCISNSSGTLFNLFCNTAKSSVYCSCIILCTKFCCACYITFNNLNLSKFTINFNYLNTYMFTCLNYIIFSQVTPYSCIKLLDCCHYTSNILIIKYCITALCVATDSLSTHNTQNGFCCVPSSTI